MTRHSHATLLTLACLAAAHLSAQQPKAGFVPARTPDGQPDIQGSWVNFDATTFESSGPGRRLTDINPPEHWADHDSPVSAKRHAMVIDPPDGLLPILPAAEKLRDKDWVMKMIRLQQNEQKQQTRTYVHLLRAASNMFKPGELERIVPRTRGDGLRESWSRGESSRSR